MSRIAGMVYAAFWSSTPGRVPVGTQGFDTLGRSSSPTAGRVVERARDEVPYFPRNQEGRDLPAEDKLVPGLGSETTPELVRPPVVPPTGLWALNATDIDGNLVRLRDFAAKVTVVVNVASHCGFTDANYRGLQRLYDSYSDNGFQVLAFPCNQFGKQEPDPNDRIKAFAQQTYNVTFPMFAKVDVNGPETHEVYKFLKQHLPADQGGGGGQPSDFPLKWNFQKFVVDNSGFPVKLHYQGFDSVELEKDIVQLLGSTTPAAL